MVEQLKITNSEYSDEDSCVESAKLLRYIPFHDNHTNLTHRIATKT